MVNSWFPDATIYGFEMVDAADSAQSGALQPSSIENLRRNQFKRIFRDFSADLLQCRYFRFIDRCYA